MSIVLSPGGTDGFRAVAYDPGGGFYAAGFARDGTDSAAAVAKFDADGRLVPAFGSGGITKKNIVQAGDVEVVTGIVVQSTGKLVTVATVENAATPTERSVVLVRFDGSGIVDPSFGTDGFVTLDLYSSGRLLVDPNDTLVVLGARRTDTQRGGAVVRLLADGAPDASFGTDGIATVVTTGEVEFVSGTLLENGSIVATGHELAEGTPSRALVAKLTSLGAPASGWGTYGFVHADVRGTAHAVVQDGASQVIAGVDRGMGFAMRIDEAGRLVPTYGYSGIARFSIADDGNGTLVRDAVELGDRRVMLVGSAIEQGRDSDAAIFLRKRYGDFDATYSLGANALFPLGGSDDAFFAAALSPDQRTVTVVGSGGAHAVVYLAPTR